MTDENNTYLFLDMEMKLVAFVVDLDVSLKHPWVDGCVLLDAYDLENGWNVN